jgi:predicted ABC-type transport system involved in lysophospholipase L1 biosynthesis ATPase subunit
MSDTVAENPALPADVESDGARNFLVGVRLAPGDRDRLLFYAKLQEKAPSTIAALLISDGVREALRRAMKPKPGSIFADEPDTPVDNLADARSV